MSTPPTWPQQMWLLRVGELRYRFFTGRPIVYVFPEQWGVDAGTIRQIAYERRYVEIEPEQPGSLRFQYAPQSVARVSPYDNYEPQPDASRGRQLLNHLSGEDTVWISVRQARMSRQHVVDVARSEGMHVAADVADETDRILLLKRDRPSGRVTWEARFLRWMVRGYVRYVGIGLIAAMTGTIWILSRFTGDSILWFLFVPLLAVVLGGAALTVFPRSSRVSWLAAKFDGSPSVQLFQSSYRLSHDLICEIAALHGYFFAGIMSTDRRYATMMFWRCGPGEPEVAHDIPRTPPRYDTPAPQPSPGRERWLRKRLAGADAVWISLLHTGLPRQSVVDAARDAGLTVSAELADATDRLMRLSRDPSPPRLPLPEPQGFRWPRKTLMVYLIPVLWLLFCFAGSAVASLAFDNRVVAGTLLGCGVLLAPPLVFVLRLFPRSTKVGWLAREFTGKNGVTLFLSTFGVSLGLATQMAAVYGYFPAGQNMTRAQGTFVSFVKYVPGGAR
ncbi:hypothetical protein [Amycolatopsis sp. NPDC058986]|uniref:hypothetical protein n=1 Tax=unclassified Amycolatopsis TaxID=2618356 RepID=UPI00366E968A